MIRLTRGGRTDGGWLRGGRPTEGEKITAAGCAGWKRRKSVIRINGILHTYIHAICFFLDKINASVDS